MSHFNDFKTQITNQAALVRALCRCKNANGQVIKLSQIEISEIAKVLTGYDARNGGKVQHANVILRKGDNHFFNDYNDIGFVKQPDGTFKAVVSDYYKDPAWLNTLFTYYNVETAKMAFEVKGKEYVESLDDKGRIQLRAKFEAPNTSRIKTRS